MPVAPEGGKGGHASLSCDALEQAVLQRFAALLSGRRCMMKHELRRDIAQERRGRQGSELAAPGALEGAAEEQPVLRARHGDVEQAALLGVWAPVIRRVFGP